MSTDSGRRLVLRASDRPGDIAGLVPPGQPAQTEAMNFGPPLPTKAAAETKAADQPTGMRVPGGGWTIGIGCLLVALALIWLTSGGSPGAAPASGAAVQVAAPTFAPPTAAPSPTPVMVPVYWSPGGESAGQVAMTAELSSTARYGEDWLAVDIPGGARVWMNMDQAQLDRTPAFYALDDLTPKPTAIPATPAPAPTAGQVECDSLDDIRYRTEWVEVYNDAGTHIGQAQGASCYSQADADANLLLQIAEVKAKHK